MKVLKGVPASPGFAIGRAYLYNDDELNVPEYEILEAEIVPERERYRAAVARAIEELELLQARENSDPDGFLATHIMMLRDPEIDTKIDIQLTKTKKNVEWVLQDVVNELLRKLGTVQDVYLKERTMDIRDVSRRVLQQLLGKAVHSSLADLKGEVILVTANLLPSDAVAMNKKSVLGLAMDAGGNTTHTAILARSFEIPAVLGCVWATREIHHGDWVIVDGENGQVLIDPSEAVIEEYNQKKFLHEKTQASLEVLGSLPCVTLDGRTFQLNANIEIPDEVESVLAHGADGIGLYRSEFLFIQNGANVSEEIQCQAYRRVLEGMGGRPVTIRTLDLGGDKLAPDLYPAKESNPLLGWRAIRFCLADRKIFQTQLRALLRASVYGNLKIMFPMISGVGELEQVLAILEEVKGQLTSEKVPFAPNIPIGTMIEVPSAAMVSDHLARLVDFFSIGTNDLTQYTLAVDRGNERIANLYEPFHPGVLRLIKMVIDNAHEAGILVAMCGEMASNSKAALILAGLGLDEFSMNAVGLPRMKSVLRSLTYSEAEHVAEDVLKMRRSDEIEAFVTAYSQGRFSPSE
jgi:phosphotransferase system enzyme I (PtsI)